MSENITEINEDHENYEDDEDDEDDCELEEQERAKLIREQSKAHDELVKRIKENYNRKSS